MKEQKTQIIEQVPNTYYYKKIYDDKHLGSFTDNTQHAYELGWQDNTVLISDTEVSELNGWTYLKGYAPNKPLQSVKDQKHNELKYILENKRKSLKVEFNDDEFDANENAQNNMNTLVGLFDLGVEQVQIRSSNEITHTFNREQCTQLSLKMVQSVQELYSTYWDLKDFLYACKTNEEVEEISWE